VTQIPSLNEKRTPPILSNKTNKNSEDIYVTRYTRGGKNGKQLVCPECDNIIRVYHFSFSGLTCPKCKQSVDKYSWKVRTIQDKLGPDSNNQDPFSTHYYLNQRG
jgi:ribosomal protein L37AE/L43A